MAASSAERSLSVYFGVIFNYRSLRVFKECVVRYWRKALETAAKRAA